MVLFKKRKNKVVDLTERYNREKERIENLKESMQESSSSVGSAPSSPGIFGMFGGGTPAVASTESDSSAEEKRKRLGKRLMDMTEKIEDQSNQIYKLQQRVELLERKSRVDY